MKRVTLLAVLMGILSSGVNAESAVSETPELTLTGNSNTADLRVVPATAINLENEALANQIEQKASETMEKVTAAMEKKLEAKLAKELKYAMQ